MYKMIGLATVLDGREPDRTNVDSLEQVGKDSFAKIEIDKESLVSEIKVGNEDDEEKEKAKREYASLLREAKELYSIENYEEAKLKYTAAIKAANGLVDAEDARNGKKKAEGGIERKLVQEKKTNDKIIEEIKQENYNKYFKDGNKYYEEGNYNQANSAYQKAQKENDSPEIKTKIADCENRLKPRPLLARDIVFASIGASMKFIPGGSYTMGCTDGSDSDCADDEKSSRLVSLNSFKMSKYEVTQEQWYTVMGTKPSDNENCNQCPVEMVHWDEVQEFLKKLNENTSKNYRLPTETEWEYAARGGQNYTYAGSSTLENIAWYKGNSENKPHPVGGKSPNGYGLYDMTGNVWEWCEDYWQGDYSKIPKDGSASDIKSIKRVIRGGSWLSYPDFCPVTYRSYYLQPVKGSLIGFRLALSQ